ncbi:CPBP family intramembrane glutamic endopeptidase [Reinekea sp. G2M2-21]|uniref:CPBP family intramembrane glutamic endopeptidase n=1 Tax=Reinekea sp. G2M2-21 TaxID=2788942 RepID=UPI0018A901E7|nr:type II CAAX endopeptidase family protein [Reinekea sp. G2M2-21]
MFLSNPMSSRQRSSLSYRWSALIGLILIAPVPTLGVGLAVFGDSGPVSSIVWMFAKVWLLVGPGLWWILVQKHPIERPTIHVNGLIPGVLSGLLLSLIIFSAYWFIARPYMDFTALRTFTSQVGITSVSVYLGLVLYLTVLNSLIEEYVFRWFMIEQLKAWLSPLIAIIVSAIIFTIHHTVVLSAYVPWYFNLLASVGVFTGGLLWSFLYQRYGQIWPCYLSHIGADIGVFLIGYHALFG